MFAAVETLRSTAMGSPAGVWMLALALLGISVMAYLTVREAGLYEEQAARRILNRNLQPIRPAVPEKENLGPWSRGRVWMRALALGSEFREALQPATSRGETGYELRLRREIDRLVGKQVYHGQKEQL